MEEVSTNLIEAAKRGDWPKASQLLSDFSSSLANEIKEVRKKSFFSKLFKKSDTFENGILVLEKCIEYDIFKNIGELQLISSLRSVFPTLMSITSPINEHKASYLMYLRIMLSISDSIHYEVIQPLGNMLLDATFFNEYNQNSSIIIPKEKNSEFTQELIDLLMDFIYDSEDKFDFWWGFLCTSLLPVLLSVPDSTVYLTAELRFDYKFIFDKIKNLIKTKEGLEKIIYFPNYALRVFNYVINEEHDKDKKEKYIFEAIDSIKNEQLHKDFMTRIFHESISRNDIQSVSMIFKTYNMYFGNLFANESDNSATFLKAKHYFSFISNELWESMIGLGDEVTIIESLTNETMKANDPFLLFSLLLFCYKANFGLPDNIANRIEGLTREMMSAIISFVCIMACAFSMQILSISSNSDPFMDDCCTKFISMNHMRLIKKYYLPETGKLIRGILITYDKRPKDMCFAYIDKFFAKTGINNGLLIAYACFIETFVSIAYELPYSRQINVFNLFQQPILKLMCSTDSYMSTEYLMSCSVALFDVCFLRGAANYMPHPIASKLVFCLIRLMSLEDKNASSIGIDLACESILSGNTVFMTIAPFLVSYLLYNIDSLTIDEKILATIASIDIFFKKFPYIYKSINAIEIRAKQLFNGSKDSTNAFSASYFTKETKFSYKTFLGDIDKLINELFAKSLSEKVISKATIMLHNTVAMNSVVSLSLLQNFVSKPVLNLITNKIALSLECLTDICVQMNAIMPNYMFNFIQSLLEDFVETEDISKLYLIVDLCIASKISLNIVGETISNKLKKNTEKEDTTKKSLLFFNLILVHISSLGKVISPTWNIINLFGIEASAMTSKSAFHIIESIGDNTITITIIPGGRSAYSYKLVNRTKVNDSVKEISVSTGEIDLENQENDKNVSSFTLFKKLKEKIIECGKNDLLCSPTDMISRDEEEQSVSPLNSEDLFNSIDLSNQNFECNIDTTLAAMCLLCLFSNRIAEDSFPEKNEWIRKTITKSLKTSIRVPVYYWPKTSNTINDAMKVKWSETSEIFKQFVTSLGDVSSDGASILYNAWGVDMIFDVIPLISEKTFNGVSSSKCNEKLQIIWFQDRIHDYYKTDCKTSVLISQQKGGFLRVNVNCKNNKNFIGPLNELNIVSANSLPSLLRSTIATAAKNSTDSLSTKNIIGKYKNDEAGLINMESFIQNA